MNLETFTLGCVMITITTIGFFYLLKIQDKWIDKMRDRFDNGDSSLRV